MLFNACSDVAKRPREQGDVDDGSKTASATRSGIKRSPWSRHELQGMMIGRSDLNIRYYQVHVALMSHKLACIVLRPALRVQLCLTGLKPPLISLSTYARFLGPGLLIERFPTQALMPVIEGLLQAGTALALLT